MQLLDVDAGRLHRHGPTRRAIHDDLDIRPGPAVPPSGHEEADEGLRLRLHGGLCYTSADVNGPASEIAED